MVKGKTPDSVDELPSNISKIPLSKGALHCSSTFDSPANYRPRSSTLTTLTVKTRTGSSGSKNLLPKVGIRKGLKSSIGKLESSSAFTNKNSEADNRVRVLTFPDNWTCRRKTISSGDSSFKEDNCKIVTNSSDKPQTFYVKRSDIVSTITVNGGQPKRDFSVKQPTRSDLTVGKSCNGKNQLASFIGKESEGAKLMSSSLMKEQNSTSQYNNYNQRNLNNNMTHSQNKSSSSNATNGYYNYPHSSSMHEFTDNSSHNNSSSRQYQSSYQQQQSSQNHQKLNNPLYYHQSSSTSNLHQQMETRKEARERREREFVPSFVLLDACKVNNERKVREICRKLSTLSAEDAQPVANFRDPAGRTPLSIACSTGSVTLIDELSRLRHLDPNLPDNDGNTPLHFCTQAGHAEAVDLMLARFGDLLDLNCRNSTGLTPLMKAALQGRTRCAKSLLSAGASAHLRDYSRGLTAAEWARLCGRNICAEVINRAAKEQHRHSGTPPSNFSPHKPLPGSLSNNELQRLTSEELPYYHLYARSTMSGATWLKNKIKRALGSSGNNSSLGDGRSTTGDGNFSLMSHLGGPTICASSLLLPSIRPLIEQQRSRNMRKKFTIPTVQVTPVKR